MCEGDVDDGSLFLVLKFSLATIIAQPTPNTRLQDHVGYKSLHVVHCKHVLLSGNRASIIVAVM